jgi:L-asparaginase
MTQYTTPKSDIAILIVYTGGTIGMFEDPKTGALSNFDFSHLVSYIPELQHFGYRIGSYAFQPPIDSSDMSPDHWKKIVEVIAANYDRYDGFVVLHGTDTMAYTASALSFMLENLHKPVILTGSQLPVGALRTDGKENLLTAVEIAAAKLPNGEAAVPEVSIFFESRLMRGNRTTKINAEGFNAFRSFNYPSLAHAGIHIRYEQQYVLRTPSEKPFTPHYDLDNHLAILTLFPGINEETVEAVLHAPHLKAVALKTFGSGNAPQRPWLIRLLRQAQERGIVVVNITQCDEGSVEMGRYATGLQLLQCGVVNGHDSTIECIVTKLMFLLGKGLEGNALRQAIEQPIAGEITAQ